MLNLITQDGMEKVAVDIYQVKNCTGTVGTYKIYGKNNGATVGELAEYEELEDAIKVFRAMTIAEVSGILIDLPDDDPKQITNFCSVIKDRADNVLDYLKR